MTATAVPLHALLTPPATRPARRILPGFNLSLGFTIFYLSLIVLIPLSALVFKSFTMTGDAFWAAISTCLLYTSDAADEMD
jgi:sulfate transport system permease protein